MKENKKAVLAIAVTLLLAAALFVGAAGADTVDTWENHRATQFSGSGDGSTADKAIEIKDAADLALLAYLVNNTASTEHTDENYSEDMFFKLTADIDLGAYNWIPIGKNDTKFTFQGTFDGDNHTISNLKINLPATSAVGLFGSMQSTDSPKISNLKIQNVQITGGSHLGALLGDINYSTNAEVSNCHVSGLIQITGGEDIGGLVGLVNHNDNSELKISNCSVIGTSQSIVQGTDVIGGIVGGSSNMTTLTLSDCVSNIDVKGQRKLGGIVGQIFSGTGGYTPRLTDVTSYGKIIVADTPSGKDVNSGTIVGHANINPGNGVTITNAVSYGSVEGWDAMPEEQKKHVGLVGGYKDNQVAELRGCVTNSTYYVTSDDDNTNLVRDATYQNELYTGGTLMVKPVAKIGTKEYYTLEQAIAAATDGQTITLIANVDLTGKYVYPGAYYHPVFKDNVTLDLNGKTITSTNATVWYQGTNLTIKNGTFVSANDGSYALGIGDGEPTKATLENLTCVGGINVYKADVTIKNTSSTGVAGTNYYAIWCDAYAHVTVEGGTFTSLSTESGSVLNCSKTKVNDEYISWMKINGGTYFATSPVKLFYDGTENLITVYGGEFSENPGSHLADGYSSKLNTTSNRWEVLPPAASITVGETTTYYATLDAAVTAVEDGQTIKLLKNIELSAPVRLDKEGTFTIDGKNHKISEAASADFDEDDGCLCFGPGGSGPWDKANIPKKIYTLKNVTLSGFKTNIKEVIRAEGCTLTIDNCTFKDNIVNGTTSRPKAVVLTTCINFTITNSVFQSNTCELCIDFNTQGGDPNQQDTSNIKVENCLFKENTVTGNGVIYVYGPAGTIKDSTFESNTITGNGVGVIYFSGKLDSLTGCLFKSNQVTETGSGKCGVLSFGSGSAGTAVTGNAFDGNTLTKTAAGKATAYVGANNINLSKNYWGGVAPVTDDEKDIYIDDGKTGTVTDPYAVSYTPRSGENTYGVTVTLPPTTATVTFDVQGHGTAPASKTVDIGSKVTRPSPDPTAWGFKFGGWFKDAACTSLWTFETDTVSGPTTLYAKWDSAFYIAKMQGYTYGAASLPSPFVEPAGLPDVSYVYSTSATGAAAPWENITSTTTLDAGTWYIGAASSDSTADIRRSAFIVEKAPRAAPVFTIDASSAAVTITGYDANETYLYKAAEKSVNANDGWKTAPGQSFTLSGLKAGTDYELTMKIAESRNYKESYSASQDFTTPGYYTVNYYANGGVGSIAPQTEQQGTEITVKSSDGISRTGYYFNEWNTKADGNGTAYTPGTPVSDGMDLYAQWTSKQYTINFDAKGGTVTPTSGSYFYTDDVTLPVAAKDGSVFSGWAVTDGSPAVYTGNQKVQGLAESGTVTLYAVWVEVEQVHTIHATIENAPAGKTITVTLMRGNAVLETLNADPYTFDNLPAGTYNLVAKALDGQTEVQTVTCAVVLGSADTPVVITFPAENVNSKVEVRNTENTPAVVVGNLDKEAETKAEGDTKVTVTLTVEAKAEAAPEDVTAPEEAEVQTSILAIKTSAPKEVSENPMMFLEISVEKETIQGTAAPVKEPIRETSEVIELIVPYDFTGKEETKVFVYRFHNGNYEPLEKNGSKKDGTYQVKKSENLIYIYTQKFSTYSIGYSLTSPAPKSSSSTGGSSIWLTETPTTAPTAQPTVEPTQGIPTVKPTTEQPTGKSPAPFVGILAGLGAAAVVFGLRRK